MIEPDVNRWFVLEGILDRVARCTLQGMAYPMLADRQDLGEFEDPRPRWQAKDNEGASNV